MNRKNNLPKAIAALGLFDRIILARKRISIPNIDRKTCLDTRPIDFLANHKNI
ncbi:MAG: hypothetical protein V3W45_04145 [Sedimentisphaerales bacterium]